MDREVDLVKKFMTARNYCKETGFPVKTMMERIVHCKAAQDCVFKASPGRTAPYYIDTIKFEKMMAAGEFKEVMES